jgi:hypothetical protein
MAQASSLTFTAPNDASSLNEVTMLNAVSVRRLSP